jgi:hypothetical protein
MPPLRGRRLVRVLAPRKVYSMSKVEFSVATLEEHKVSTNNRTAFARPLSLSPLEAYLGLKSLFGKPNREHIDPTKQQWVFLLKTDGARIEINDWKLESWSIHIYEQNKDEARAKRLIKELERQIIQASAKHRALVSNLLKNPAGHVIENPFALYYRTARELLAIAEELRKEHGNLPSAATKLGDSTRYTLCRAAFFHLIAAVEGWLNLVYEVYLKAELRDNRIVDRLAREQIDVKLRLAPIYCDCFAGRPIDHTTEAFRNFNRLVNARNDFIHANVTTSMKTPVVSHDDMTFITSTENPENGIVPGLMSDLGIEDVQKIKAVVDDILAQTLASMKPRDRREFESVMHEEFINVEYEDGVPVIVG